MIFNRNTHTYYGSKRTYFKKYLSETSICIQYIVYEYYFHCVIENVNTRISSSSRKPNSNGSLSDVELVIVIIVLVEVVATVAVEDVHYYYYYW